MSTIASGVVLSSGETAVNETLPWQVEQPSLIHVMEREVLGIPQIYTGRGQGRTPTISDFNLEWLRRPRLEEGGWGGGSTGNLQLSENVALSVRLKIRWTAVRIG